VLLTIGRQYGFVHCSEPGPLDSIVRLEAQPEVPRGRPDDVGEDLAAELTDEAVIPMTTVPYLQVVIRAVVTVLDVERVPEVQLQYVSRFG
jgi:hypothetical protein